jgi:hypothetical protein
MKTFIFICVLLFVGNSFLLVTLFRFQNSMRKRIDEIGISIQMSPELWDSAEVAGKNSEMWHKDLDVLYGLIQKVIYLYSAGSVAILLCLLCLIWFCHHKSGRCSDNMNEVLGN